MAEQRVGWISKDMIRRSKNTVYVFGDNRQRTGNGGQAFVARSFVEKRKSHGLVTKNGPGTSKKDYFSDQEDEIDAVKKDFAQILKFKRNGKKIIFFPGIGEGRAELKARSPLIWSMIRDFIAINGDVDFDMMLGKR